MSAISHRRARSLSVSVPSGSATSRQVPFSRPLAGPIQLRRISPEEQAKSENLPIDPIFAAFIACVGEPDNVLTARDIVLNLRGEMRRELGLDKVLGWPGGPGIGIA